MRPGTENDDDDDDEKIIQSCVYSDSKLPVSSSPSPRSNSTPGGSPKPPRPPPPQIHGNKNVSGGDKVTSDPEASLISDFQIITDIRVSVTL